jgi:DNA processing protein
MAEPNDRLAAAWLAVALVPELRAGRFRERIRVGEAGLPELAGDPALATKLAATLAPATEMVRRLAPGDRVVPWVDPLYPSTLREIADPPAILFARGGLDAIVEPCIAIVGSRDASAYGLGVARELAESLAGMGITVVSGLALGIDATAHRGALLGGGRTVAVVGAGVDVDYPRPNRRLRDEIPRTGTILSELPHGTPPLKQHFPERNRLISGLSHGVIVVEASLRSGSLVTARHALEQGREIFAVPGPIASPRSRGPHLLLKNGAKLVETVDDVLVELPRLAAWMKAARATIETHPEDGPLLAAIVGGAGTVDEIATQLGRNVPELWSDLLDLELRGRLVRGPGGRFSANRSVGTAL